MFSVCVFVCVCVCAPCGRGTAVTGKHQAQKLLSGCKRRIDRNNMKSAPEYVEMYQRTKGSLSKKKNPENNKTNQNDRVFIQADYAGIGNTQPKYMHFEPLNLLHEAQGDKYY